MDSVKKLLCLLKIRACKPSQSIAQGENYESEYAHYMSPLTMIG